MLGKLIKYEIKSVARTLGPIYLAVLVLAVIMEPTRNISAGIMNDYFFGIVAIIFSALLIAMMVITFVTIVQRFSKTMFGNEGYLMHTLPVTTNQHLLAKLITGMLIGFVSTVVITLAVLLMVLSSDITYLMPEFFDLMREAINQVINLDSVTLLVYVEMFISSVLSSALSLLTLYLAMCVGNLFPGKSMIASIFAFLGLSTTQSMLGDLYNNVFNMPNIFDYGIYGRISLGEGYHFYAWATILYTAAMVVALYYATHYILNKKLNLQ